MSQQRSQTFRGRLAVELLREHVNQQYQGRFGHPASEGGADDIQVNALSELPDFDGIPYPSLEAPPPDSDDTPDEGASPGDGDGLKAPGGGSKLDGKVCIVGAGAAGIYMAWMLTYLGIDYDLLEASNRIGGRVYTHSGFKSDRPEEKCAHNYYDVGAMRIPHILSNQTTIDVLDYLKKEKLLDYAPYYLENKTAPQFFDRASITSDTVSNKLKPLTDYIGTIVTAINDEKPGHLDEKFKELLKSDIDQFSTREYLRTHVPGQEKPQKGLDFAQIQELETFNTGTGLFDQSLLETILDAADFPDKATWSRVEGGMIKLIEGMAAKIKHNPVKLNHTVREFRMNGSEVDVTFTNPSGDNVTQTYSAVFTSTTLGALGRIELNDLGSETQLTAIRALSYDSAAKLAIKFKTAWWHTKGKMLNPDGSIAPGGISGTDLPIRVIAYPAWTDIDDPKKPTVLIAAYTWHQDAIRMGSLDGSEAMRLVLQNLAAMFHDRDPSITYDFLKDQVIDHHAYAWQNDPYASGAFALFGPGQFTGLYPALFSPLKGSNNSIYMIGEAASAHHAWIAGAFNSAATSLYGWLLGLGIKGRIAAGHLKYSRILPGRLPFGGSIDKNADPTKWHKNEGVPDEMDERLVYCMAQLALDKPTDPKFVKN